MRAARAALLLAGFSVTDAAAQAEWHATFSGMGHVEALDRDLESARFHALVEGDVPLAARVRLHAGAAIENDFRDALEPGRPDQSNRAHASRRWLIDDSGSAELEEFFVDWRAGAWSVRLGKQQTVWGTSDGLKVLDIVNPQSFREFILDDYERSRIP
ncbi:MAG TPA: hypothetical protein VJM11_19320, partial [Nevskiaceae bacterium]|nr:hypothetical protein [Nevskiaceae bacterium]